MPRSALSPCSVVGCQAMATRGSLCEDHKYRSANPWQPFYMTKEWKRLSGLVKAQERACRRCGGTVDLEVDHITALADGGERLDRANLQVLCRDCHARKTALDVRKRRTEGRRYLTPTR